MLIKSELQAIQPAKFAVSALTMAMLMTTLMVSPARADDLEIYQPALTGGGKTLVMMLDASGQMNSKNPSGLDQVVAGMKNLLQTDDPNVNPVAIGLGHYNSKNDSNGSNTTGDIIVPAAVLGTLASSGATAANGWVPQTGQRKKLWDMVVAGSGNGNSAIPAVTDPDNSANTYTFAGNGPASPMQGLAEAAAYVLGTTTYSVATAGNSGFAASITASKTGTHYNSPLSNTGTCGGTGLYFLTSGQFVSTTTVESDALFNRVLTPVGGTTPTSLSTCTADGYTATPGLAAVSNAPWNCLASFAKQLYDPSKNPAGAQIKTAFVGFGTNFSTLGDSAAINTCHIGSKLKGDACSPDASITANQNPASGYGNGGFYSANSAADVTASVKNFILTLGSDTVTPLVTGAPTIPIDDLNPNGFQNYGYLRMIAPNPTKPAKMLWQGDVKKYSLAGGALMSNGWTSGTDTVMAADGTLRTGTTDNWNAAGGNDVPAGTGDGGSLTQGGAYPKVPMPTTTYINKIRPLFTDIGTVTQVTSSTSGLTNTASKTYTTTGITADFTDTLASVANGSSLVPVKPVDSTGALVTNLQTSIPQMFDSSNTTVSSGSVLKQLSIVQKKKLINYLGFNTPIYGSDNQPLVANRVPSQVFGTTTLPDGTVVTDYYADPVGVPSDLGAPPSAAYLAMGGSIHAQPIQFSYLSDVSSTGVITNRQESVLYGSMEGALHMVNATTGVEQMAFVPAEILADDIVSRGLRVDEENKSSTSVNDLRTPSVGVDGPWVADPAYKTAKGTTTTTGGTTTTTSATLSASRMNVYGGLRMGGMSYYGLDLLDKSGDVVKPKLLFRISAPFSTSSSDPMYHKGFDRMGQSWSKPVLANVRYNNVVTRVMIVGGGYDTCYESPNFMLNSTSNTNTACNSKTAAQGNAVYMVDATTGALIWEAVGTSGITIPSNARQIVNTNMIHSIPGRVSAVDRDGDGLIDSIYFADLGGQVFRADFNNAYGTNRDYFGARVTRLANLGTTTTGASITNGTNPRFYEAPTITIHRNGSTFFALVADASGNRSNPLDVLPVAQGGKGLNSETSPTPTPTPPLPVNNVYGIIDRDLGRSDLLNLVSGSYKNSDGTNYTANTADLTLQTFQKDPQTLGLTANVYNTFFTGGTSMKNGWYRSLSSRNGGTATSFDGTVTELSESSYMYAAWGGLPSRKMYAGGLKAFEEKIALKNELFIPIYDPEGTGVNGSSCQARVVGETDMQKYCLPFGVCLTASGTIDRSAEAKAGSQYTINGSTITNGAVIGPGIRGVALGDYSDVQSGGQCKSFALVGNTQDTSKPYYTCTKTLTPTLWYEKQPNTSKVK